MPGNVNHEINNYKERLQLPPVEIFFTSAGIIVTYYYRAKDVLNPSNQYLRPQSFALPAVENDETVQLRPYLGEIIVREEDPEAFLLLIDSIVKKRREPQLNKQQRKNLLTILNEIAKLLRRYDVDLHKLMASGYNRLKVAKLGEKNQKENYKDQYIESAHAFHNLLSSFFQETDFLDKFKANPENVAALKARLEKIYSNKEFVSRVLRALGLNGSAETTISEEHANRITELEQVAEKLADLLEDWTNNTDYPSSMYIREIHKTIINPDDYSELGLVPQQPGEYRTTDVHSSSKSEDNFYAPGLEVKPLMSKYCEDLDKILVHIKPIDPKDPIAETMLRFTIHVAAWAYYVFGRIHPFLDGSGRTGRTILQRVLKGAGLRTINFDSLYTPENRSAHLDSLFTVDNELNLWPLTMYITLQLREQYKTFEPNSPFIKFLEKQLGMTAHYIPSYWRSEEETNVGALDNIWSMFGKLDLYGTKDPTISEHLLRRNFLNYIRAFHS